MSSRATRGQIVEAADQLFYRQGYDHTSFANIAGAVNISRGNFYHHFKSKDDILNAVIAKRLDDTKGMLAQWECEEHTPEKRIKCYIKILLTNWGKIKDFGCPVGTLCTELAKLNHVSQQEAREIFTIFHKWLKQQFNLLGFKKGADNLAMHVLAWSQGVATLANAYQDEKFVMREVREKCEWLDRLIKQKDE